jgi:hypothetical protein
MRAADMDHYVRVDGDDRRAMSMSPSSRVIVAPTLLLALVAAGLFLHGSSSRALVEVRDYAVLAKQYGQAIDEGIGWAGIVKEVTESDTTPWSGHVCMINAWGITTVKDYAEWNVASVPQFPDIKATNWTAAWDPFSRNAFVYGVWTGTNSAGPGHTDRFATGPFVYMLHFNEHAKVDRFTKVWNDAHSARQYAGMEPKLVFPTASETNVASRPAPRRLGWGDMCHCPPKIPGFPCYDPPLGPKSKAPLVQAHIAHLPTADEMR